MVEEDAFDLSGLPHPPVRHILEHIVHADADSAQVFLAQRCKHPGCVRMPAQAYFIQLPEQFRRGNGKARFAYDNPARRKRRKILQLFAPALCELGTAGNTESHIRTDLPGEGFEFLPVERRAEKPVHATQNRCRIGRTARHSGTDRDVLLQTDGDARRFMLILSDCLKIDLRCAHGQIPPVRRDIAEVAFGLNSGFFRQFQVNAVGHGNGLHHHQHVMIPVFPPAGYIQAQVQLCICVFRHAFLSPS